jgi:DNA-3-methyladenine glycosylase
VRFWEDKLRFKKVKRNFYNRDTLKVAQELLGKYLVRKTKQRVKAGKIVETEAYIGQDDDACHASRGKTERTEVMFGKAGCAYIYLIYGMYWCLNIVAERKGFPAAVLIRALEPVEKSKMPLRGNHSLISKNQK